jgi:hypothetical protein
MPIRRSPNGAGYTRPQPGRDRSEWMVAINRNQWSQSIVIGGRDRSVRPVAGTTLYDNARRACHKSRQIRRVEVVSDDADDHRYMQRCRG